PTSPIAVGRRHAPPAQRPFAATKPSDQPEVRLESSWFRWVPRKICMAHSVAAPPTRAIINGTISPLQESSTRTAPVPSAVVIKLAEYLNSAKNAPQYNRYG